VALADPNDSAHETCLAALKSFRGNLITSWPVLAEAFYLLRAQVQRDVLWEFIFGGALRLGDIFPPELPRMRWLMAKYSDLPMDLADASLVVLAERLKLGKVFTIDRRDFRLYRPRHVRSFEVFP